jgi:hypothetical protein
MTSISTRRYDVCIHSYAIQVNSKLPDRVGSAATIPHSFMNAFSTPSLNDLLRQYGLAQGKCRGEHGESVQLTGFRFIFKAK